MAEPYKVGDRVRAKEAIYEPADDHAPGGYLCMKGDLLIVRKLTPQFKRSLSVSHESETERSFGVEPSEVEPDGVMATDARGSEALVNAYGNAERCHASAIYCGAPTEVVSEWQRKVFDTHAALVAALGVSGAQPQRCEACNGTGLDPANRETCIVCGGAGSITSESATEVKESTRGVPASDDTARLDYLQRTGSTLEILPRTAQGARFRFRVGGLHAAVSDDLRAAIDTAAGMTAAHHQTEAPADADDPGIGHE